MAVNDPTGPRATERHDKALVVGTGPVIAVSELDRIANGHRCHALVRVTYTFVPIEYVV